MKKLLLISLIIGTALSQLDYERNRIALLRRRQQLANLSERELINGGFLPYGSSRVSKGFRGSDPSFDELTGRRRRFQSNVVFQNVDKPVSGRRSYLQSLRSSLRRNGGRTGRARGSFWKTDRPVNEQNVRRTYMPAIKRPRFTPNIKDILPRRMPSYSPTARGIDSNWTPRLPSTVSGAGNFLPSNMNDFIERTNPVNDRSYVSPKKPSLIVEPIPLPSLRDPEHITAKEQIPSQTHTPDYVAPMDPVLPVQHKTDPNYVVDAALNDPFGPLDMSTFPLDINDPSYVDPMLSPDPFGPFNSLLNPKLPTNVKDPNYSADKVLKDPLGPLDSPSLLLDINDPGYVDPAQTDPLSPLTNGKDPNYVANQELKDPLGPLDSPSLLLDINDPGYVDPAQTDPLSPLTNGKDPNYVANQELKEPLGPLDSPRLPLDINEPGYVDPGLSGSMGPIGDPRFPDTLPTDTLFEPLLPKGGLMSDPLASFKNGNPNYVPSNDPQALFNDNQANAFPDAFGLLDLPQDPTSSRGPFAQLPPDNVSPTDGSLPSDIPSLPGLLDPVNTDFGSNGGSTDLLMNPSNYQPEPPLPHSPLFDSNLPPVPNMNGFNLDQSIPEMNGSPLDPFIPDMNGSPWDPPFPDMNGSPWDPPFPDMDGSPGDPPIPDMNGSPLDTPDMNGSPVDPSIPNQFMTRSEINEAARREYAKSPGAFDPKWNNPNVRNSNLYVKGKPDNQKDARHARGKTQSGSTAVDKDIENKTAKSKWSEGYISKPDALRSYEGVINGQLFGCSEDRERVRATELMFQEAGTMQYFYKSI
ncbi:Discoidin domain-containing receptor 2 [Mizuhopecten yessoensis]|uniref:Discoidin domain-containing receptor 2 n=1 Tax=Mizuhopecten yessoensis TaxID=6573 RepID=A0A210Q310_MIZYE|nr:Discoidin domain-containing receptor 2 [Mizuhopecten yessoensis]